MEKGNRLIKQPYAITMARVCRQLSITIIEAASFTAQRKYLPRLQ